MKMFQVQFHTGFVPRNATTVKFAKYDLDACDIQEKYPDLFQINLNIEVEPRDRPSAKTPPWEGIQTKGLNPKILFSSRDEQQEILSKFGKPELPRQPGSSVFYESESPQPAQTPDSANATDAESPADSNANNFFQTLDWEDTSGARDEGQSGSFNDQDTLSDQSDGESVSYSAPSAEPLSRDTSEPLFDADFQTPPPSAPEPAADTADLLGLNSDSRAAEIQTGLKSASSNSDLLNDIFAPPAGHSAAVQEDLFFSGPSPDPKPVDDLFDPFGVAGSGSVSSQQDSGPDLFENFLGPESSAPASNSSLFNLNKLVNDGPKMTSSASQPDLLGGWESWATTGSSVSSTSKPGYTNTGTGEWGRRGGEERRGEEGRGEEGRGIL
uniref:C2 tensin-type domain-containing protein n=1 Tax=Knipowitschia caucasica TaxID=637954 RepID=A0AAV2MN89_KNICA